MSKTILVIDPQPDLWKPGSTIRWDDLRESRLLEHPGHADQKVHGRRGGSSDLAGLDAELRAVRGGERLVAMKDGKIVFDKGGAGTSIQLNHADDMALKGSIASHNHPTGWQHPEGTIERNGNGPSQPDLETAWRAGVEEMRIVTPGSVYSVKQGSDTTWGAASDARQKEVNRYGPVPAIVDGRAYSEAERAMSNSLHNISSDVQNSFTADIDAGRKTIGQAQMLHYDEVLRRAGAEHGWEVSITRNSDYVDVMSGPSVTDGTYRMEGPTQTFDQRFGSMFGNSPLPGMGQQSQVGESLERRVARELIRHTVRLLEHPGHGNQKVHGRRGGVDVSGTQLANISASTRAKIQAKADSLGLPSSEQMAADIGAAYDAASPGAKKTGMTWYEDAHKEGQALAEMDGHTLEGTAAVMAICSPTRQWASNLAVTREISSVVGKNKEFEVTAELGGSARPPIKAGIYKPSDLTSGQLAWTHPQFKNSAIAAKYGLSGKEARAGRDHYGQISTSVDVLRGDLTPNQALTGVKTRNFYNNIYDPRAGNVTIDDWAYKSALGTTPVTVRYGKPAQTYSGPANEAPYGTLGSLMQGSPVVKGEGYKAGVYPVVAEAYSIAASKAGILPQQMQAVVWESAREQGTYVP